MNEGNEPCLVLKVTGQKSGKVALFMKLDALFPECSYLIKGADQLYPLFCLKNNVCPRNANCMERLAKRTKYVFDTFPDADLLLLYFRYADMPNSHRAGVFWRDMREPRYVTFNRAVWEKMKKVGIVYEWVLPDNLFLS